MCHRFNNFNFSKWQLALIIGTPLAIAFCRYVYSKAVSKRNKAKDRKEGRNAKAEESSNNEVSDAYKLEQAKSTNLEQDDVKSAQLQAAIAHKNEGDNWYDKGKFDEAIKCYDSAIEKCPKSSTADLSICYHCRAAAYEMIKKWTHVKEDCNRSLALNPRYAKAYFCRAKAFEATHEMLECLEDVTAACVLEMFQNGDTILYADRILKQTGREDAERGFKNRGAILASKSFVSTYLRSFVADPMQTLDLPPHAMTSIPRGIVQAKLALEKEEFDDIIPACTEEIESNETETLYKLAALLMRGTFHLLSNSFKQAHQDFDAVIDSVDADVMLRSNALIKRASLHIQLDRKEVGLSDFEAAEKLQPQNPDVYNQRAQIYMSSDLFENALEELLKACQLAPQHAMANVQKCYAEYRISLLSQDHMRLIKVMKDFQEVIAKFPECVECYTVVAQVLSDQQQFLQADEFYKKAIAKAPRNAKLYVHRGILILQWKGDIDTAIAHMQHAIKVDEKCELAYETLGTMEVQRANLDRAVTFFEKAIELAKSQVKMCHLYALRNAAVAQINVTHKLGIDMSTITALAKSQTNMQGL